ncbi:MAG TPA: peptidoglycan-binding protein [Coriobacteriia bacterium]|nr:peptidoglycan-binding protein [Coriobacteriia bacterium]
MTNSPTETAETGTQTIGLGFEGSAVKDVQQRLQSLGYDLGEEAERGVFAELTAQAVSAFRESVGLDSGNEVTRDTWTSLVDATFTLGDRLLYLRMPYFHGRDVRVLQTALSVLGFFCPADSIFGVRTEHAVREFQQNAGIDSDGIVGDSTFSAIKRLRHAWEDKEMLASPAPAAGFARAAEVLESTAFCLYGIDAATQSIAGRVCNLALATTANSLVFCGKPEDREIDEQILIVELVGRDGEAHRPEFDLEHSPIPKVIYDSDATINVRMATAIDLISSKHKKIIILLNYPTSGAEFLSARQEQHIAIALLDALCSAFDQQRP